MRLIKNTNVNFVGNFKLWATISATLVVLGWLLFLFKGLNYGVDFAGGTEIQLEVNGINTNQLRKSLKDFGKIEIQKFEGKDNEFLIRMKNISVANPKQVDNFISKVKATFSDVKILKTHFDSQVGDRVELWLSQSVDKSKLEKLAKENSLPVTGTIEYSRVGERHIYKIMLQGLTDKIMTTVRSKLSKNAKLMRVELVGPKVGKRLRVDAFEAIIYSLIAILIYIAFRFNYQFAPGAVIALIHDVSITVGVFSLFSIPFDLTIVAALLTIVGYSLNDTIVVYDRIRENFNNEKKGKTLADRINKSINETLSRTLLTSLTTLIVLVILLIFGGGIIRGFAFAMTFGVIVGTYSSVFIASPVTILIDNYMKSKKAKTA